MADAQKRKKVTGSKKAKQFTVQEAAVQYSGTTFSVRGKPVKIPTDFDTALSALITVPQPKKRRKAGRA